MRLRLSLVELEVQKGVKPQNTMKNKVSLIEVYEQFPLYSIKRNAHGCQWRMVAKVENFDHNS